MCLVAIWVAPHPRLSWVLAANRDEAHDRPTLTAAAWEEAPQIFGGRDLRAGGTWLAISGAGRVAAITNVRDPSARRDGRTRGDIPRSFLLGSESAETFARDLASIAPEYPAFNLIVGDAVSGLFYTNELGEPPVHLTAGVHAVSNARLGVPWPKAVRAREALQSSVSPAGDVDEEVLFRMLADDLPAPDEALPSTGVPLEIERLLSSPFVKGDVYGTRSSTVIVARPDAWTSEERSFGPGGRRLEPAARATVPLTRRAQVE